MIFEILFTVEFIASLIKNTGLYIPKSKITAFKKILTKMLIKNYVKHWDETNPEKYKNLRSIKFNYYIDDIILKAWTHKTVNLPSHITKLIFPTDLLIYCNPKSVKIVHKANTIILFQPLTQI